MNIFYFSPQIEECARMHCNSYSIKMILEYAQLLSTAHRVLDFDNVFLYKATHLNHPSAIWTRSNRSCYNYLHTLLIALCEEYTYRYGKIHKVESSGLLNRLATPPKNIPDGEFTEPTPAMPLKFIVPGDSVESYRRYYVGAKRHLAYWKNREQPYWYK